MHVEISRGARAVLLDLSSHDYHAVWTAIDRIALDPEGAKTAPWVNYVSSKGVWGEHVRGTEYSLFWDVQGDVLQVHWLLEEG